ncbi:unnamed protein product [Prorocentrum cordatum]|uniref:Tubulin-specific chaperone A n=1 Tax=Prorocentrum cordatum TaxID=2364126 RepID=A0ABN9W6P4_9DINO|nr:unnamed protein product [Polarella glacialis]
MTEAETEEKDSQADYDKTIAGAKDKRMTDSKALTSKAAEKADLESDLQAAKGDSASTAKALMATDKYLSQLHAECDWLIQARWRISMQGRRRAVGRSTRSERPRLC